MLNNYIFQHETEFLEDNLALSGFTPFTSKLVSSEEEFFDSDDVMTSRLPRPRSTAVQNLHPYDTNLPMVPTVSTKQELKRRHVPHGWPHKMVITYMYIDCLFFVRSSFPSILLYLKKGNSCRFFSFSFSFYLHIQCVMVDEFCGMELCRIHLNRFYCSQSHYFLISWQWQVFCHQILSRKMGCQHNQVDFVEELAEAAA
jgi:hypothetical protein